MTTTNQPDAQPAEIAAVLYAMAWRLEGSDLPVEIGEKELCAIWRETADRLGDEDHGWTSLDDSLVSLIVAQAWVMTDPEERAALVADWDAAGSPCTTDTAGGAQ